MTAATTAPVSDPDALPGCAGAATAWLVEVVVRRGAVVVDVGAVESGARKATTRSADVTRR